MFTPFTAKTEKADDGAVGNLCALRQSIVKLVGDGVGKPRPAAVGPRWWSGLWVEGDRVATVRENPPLGAEDWAEFRRRSALARRA